MNNKQRREKTLAKLKEQRLAYNGSLPLLESDLTLKNKAEVCRRAIANILAIQHALSYDRGTKIDESRLFFGLLLKSYGVENDLLPIEERLFKGKCTRQDAINVSWTYETNWVLLWALGKIDELDFPKDACDTEKTVKIYQSFSHVDEFMQACRLRSLDEILDELDLYYCYHWACVENTLDPEANVGALCFDVVVERRKALEWLVSDEYDWDKVTLDT